LNEVKNNKVKKVLALGGNGAGNSQLRDVVLVGLSCTIMILTNRSYVQSCITAKKKLLARSVRPGKLMVSFIYTDAFIVRSSALQQVDTISIRVDTKKFTIYDNDNAITMAGPADNRHPCPGKFMCDGAISIP
jgi:hypothetical protein